MVVILVSCCLFLISWAIREIGTERKKNDSESLSSYVYCLVCLPRCSGGEAGREMGEHQKYGHEGDTVQLEELLSAGIISTGISVLAASSLRCLLHHCTGSLQVH